MSLLDVAELSYFSGTLDNPPGRRRRETKRDPGHIEMTQLAEHGSIIAVFDIGSNSVKMSVGRCGDDGSSREFAWRSATTRLSAGVDRTGRLADERMEATLEALEEMALQARALGARQLIAVATEAARIASNGPEFLDRVHEATGIEVEAISGDLEVALTFLGLARTVDRNGTMVVADIGGGSTELIVSVDGTMISGKSWPIGSGRISDEFPAGDPPDSSTLQSMRDAIRERLRDAELPERSARLVIVGGTGEFLGRLLPRDFPVPISMVESALKRTSTMSAAELSRKIDINIERARVLPAGIATALAIADICCPTILIGAPSGIRAGLLRLACSGEL
jgi:exopolyphosphatase/guanosine-5'-triphosphate,3'-diphosphate pyrophosphatase